MRAQVYLTIELGCRDQGSRVDRQKARLMWMVEEWGVDKFREMIEQQMGDKLAKGVRAARSPLMPRDAGPATEDTTYGST